MPEEQDVLERMRKIGELIRQFEREEADPASRNRAIELIRLLMEVHGAGLERMLALITESSAATPLDRAAPIDAPATLDRLAGDPLVASLLLLYGLHPVDLSTRVRQALEKVRPYLQSHGGNVELVSIEDGAVRLEFSGSCHGCPSSALTLKNTIEEAIYEFAPDVTDLHVVGAAEKQTATGPMSLPVITV